MDHHGQGRHTGGRGSGGRRGAIRQVPYIDRRRSCPSLVSAYFSTTAATPEPEALRERYAAPPDALLHFWSDATLREMCDVLELAGDASSATAYRVSLIYPDARGNVTLRPVGRVHRYQRLPSDDMTLQMAGFKPGDAIEVQLEGSQKQEQQEGAEL